MNNDVIEKEFYRLNAGTLMADAFADHVRCHPGRSVAECLEDPLPIEIKTIEIPSSYCLEERYQRTRSTQSHLPRETPVTSFMIQALTWKDLGAATFSFEDVACNFDIYPSGILIEGNVALVICDT